MPVRTIFITRDEEEIELFAEYTRSRFYPATGPSWDSPGEPAEGGEARDLSVTRDGKDFPLTQVEQFAIYAELDEDVYGEHDHG